MKLKLHNYGLDTLNLTIFGAYGHTFVGLNIFYTSLHRKAADSGLEADVFFLVLFLRLT